MIRAIIFDLDDTLYQEMQFVRAGFRRVASYISQKYNLNQKKAYGALLKALKERGRGKVFDIALETLGLPNKKKTVLKMVSMYRYQDSKLVLYSEAREVLLNLKDKQYRLGLITDGNARVQRHKVELLGLEYFFDCMIFSREYGIKNEKPSLMIFKKCLHKLRVEPGESILVGDNLYKDFISAKKLGICTLRVMRGQFKDVVLNKEYEADYRVNSLKKIFHIINILSKS